MDGNNRPARNFSRERTAPPSHSMNVSALVSRLLNHYWTANDPAAMREAQIADWLEDLIEFSEREIDAACRAWRQTENRRPSPAEIRALAVAEQCRAAGRDELRALPAPEPIPRPKKLACWEPGYAARYDEPWFRALPLETRLRYKEQDLARAEARRTGTDAEFMELCQAQAKENLAGKKIATRRNPAAEVLEDMGVTAAERKPSPKRYESPEVLRLARIELGLEQPDDEVAWADDRAI